MRITFYWHFKPNMFMSNNFFMADLSRKTKMQAN